MEQIKEILPGVLSESLKKEQPININICEKHGIEKTDIYNQGSLKWFQCHICAKEHKAAEAIRIEGYRKKREETKEDVIKKILVGSCFSIPPIFNNSNTKDFNREYSIGEKCNTVFITGKCGTGKTHLATAILKKEYIAIAVKMFEIERLESHEIGDKLRGEKYFNWPSILIRVKSSFSNEAGETMYNVISKIPKKLIILDDIGVAKPTETAVESTYHIVNERYEWLIPTIYTSNLSLSEISNYYGDRIASRLASGQAIMLDGKDRRVK